MRNLLCRWSFMLDKRAARDARAYKASIDVRSYEAFVGMVAQAQKECIERQPASCCEPSNGYMEPNP
eukprot:8797406-Prorocentrum_lima.AAC.1